jgi:hypothetical protein
MVDREGDLKLLPDARLIVQVARSAAAVRIAPDCEVMAATVGRISDQGVAARQPALQRHVDVSSRRERGKRSAVGIAQVEQADGDRLEHDRVKAQVKGLRPHAPSPAVVAHVTSMGSRLAW